ncbi:MAG: hypothetical protein ACOYOP_16445 [Microthrixaceae bacterium]
MTTHTHPAARRRAMLAIGLTAGALLLAACTPTPSPQPTTTTTSTSTTTTIVVGPEANPCPVGYFNSSTGRAPCTAAPAGFFVDVQEARVPSPCALGSYQPSAGQSSCLLAGVGFYVDVIAATSQTACPALTTTVGTGWISPWGCVGIVPATLVFSNTQDPDTRSNWGTLTGAGLRPGAPITFCGDQFGCRTAGFTVKPDGTVPRVGYIFPGAPQCYTNVSYSTLAADGTPISSATLSYPPGTPGCP